MNYLPRPFACLKFFRLIYASSISTLGVVVPLLFPAALVAQSVSFAGTSLSVNFGNVNLCKPGSVAPAPCDETLTLKYNVTASGTLGAIHVVAQGTPNLDFTLAGGSTCTGNVTAGNACVVNVKFAPLFAGTRPGGVYLTDDSGNVLATTLIYGYGVGPQIGTTSDPILKSLSPAEQALPPVLGVLDGAGDLFVANDAAYGGAVTEYPVGGGASVTLPFLGLNYPSAVAVDANGDVFVSAENEIFATQDVLELPAGCQSSDCQVAVFSGYVGGIAALKPGVVFVQGRSVQDTTGSNQVVEVPSGGGTPVSTVTLPAAGGYTALGVDGSNNYFTTGSTPNSAAATLVAFPAGSSAPIILDNNVGAVTGGNDYTDISVATDITGDIFATLSTYFFDGPIIGSVTTEDEISQFAPLRFGAIAPGAKAQQSLAIINTGNQPLTVAASSNSSSFVVAGLAPADCLASMVPGQTCTLQIEFAPEVPGPSVGRLTLVTNGTVNPEIDLEGTAGVAAPVIGLFSGVYASPQTTAITDTTPGAAIYYTTNGTVPTASSARYTAPITVSSTETVAAVAILDNTPSLVSSSSYTMVTDVIAQIDNFSEGFAAAIGPIQFNRAGLDGSRLELTSAEDYLAATSAFYASRVNVQSFATDFTFQLTDAVAEGFTFTIQNAGDTKIGTDGAGLGYEGIGESVAIKFDLYSNAGEGPDSTGLYTNGAIPTVPAINLTGSGINLHSGDIFLAQINYNGTTLTLTITDTFTLASWSHSFAIDIPATIGSDTAFVGFTGSVGDSAATQEILYWTYVAGKLSAPPPPPPLPAVPEYPAGFNATGLSSNGGATISGTSLMLTDGGYEHAGSTFYKAPLNIQAFTSDFIFQLTNPGQPLVAIADGFTFTIQNAGPNALGGTGESLGYASIGKSVALKFDLHNNAGEGQDSTGLYIDGAMPTVPSVDLTGTGIGLHSGDPFAAHITYSGADLELTITDLFTLAVWSHSFPVNIPTIVGGNTAYVGFTGSTGGSSAVQDILSWTFSNP